MSDLYLECNSGISGDMAVAALLDAGADEALLREALDSIPAKGFEIKISRVKKNGIDCADFDVILDAEHQNHDHDMEYLFGHECAELHHHDHEHSHEHEHGGHDHEHSEHSHERHHHYEHRNLSDIEKIIDGTKMSEAARALAKKIFGIIARAESAAHGVPLEEVHFHEVGAIDSIVDVIALAVCFESLSPGRVYVPFLCEGTGTVRCQHGILPVPVPAVANIAASYKLPLRIMPEKGEFVTPTGAAFVAAVMTDAALPQKFSITKIGLGAGKRNYERSSLVRAMLIESLGSSGDTAVKLETNVDDCSGEALGFAMEELFKAGARDVHYVPCFMKKNRPAYLLSVICEERDREKMEGIIFSHTTTIGIRRSKMERTVLPREEFSVQTEYGEIRAKAVVLPDGSRRVQPEYESAAKIARGKKRPFCEVYQELLALLKDAGR